MEPTSNFGFRCPNHGLKPNPKFLDVPREEFIGTYCKLAFPTDDGRKEYMWVRVIELAEDGEELRGVLDNDPVLPMDAKCGDYFEFSRKEIIEVMT